MNTAQDSSKIQQIFEINAMGVTADAVRKLVNENVQRNAKFGDSPEETIVSMVIALLSDAQEMIPQGEDAQFSDRMAVKMLNRAKFILMDSIKQAD
jgi:hypothetical protein